MSQSFISRKSGASCKVWKVSLSESKTGIKGEISKKEKGTRWRMSAYDTEPAQFCKRGLGGCQRIASPQQLYSQVLPKAESAGH